MEALLKKQPEPAAPLPDPCHLCAPQDGNWMVKPSGGLDRCTCARGDRLKADDEERKRQQKLKAEKEAELDRKKKQKRRGQYFARRRQEDRKGRAAGPDL